MALAEARGRTITVGVAELLLLKARSQALAVRIRERLALGRREAGRAFARAILAHTVSVARRVARARGRIAGRTGPAAVALARAATLTNAVA